MPLFGIPKPSLGTSSRTCLLALLSPTHWWGVVSVVLLHFCTTCASFGEAVTAFVLDFQGCYTVNSLGRQSARLWSKEQVCLQPWKTETRSVGCRRQPYCSLPKMQFSSGKVSSPVMHCRALAGVTQPSWLCPGTSTDADTWITVIAASNTVLRLRPRSLVSSVSIHETVAGHLVRLTGGQSQPLYLPELV